jgi:hypothetical protein
MINIPSTHLTAPKLCKIVSLQCYVVANVIHIHSVRCQICVCVSTHVVNNMQSVVWDSVECCVAFWARVPYVGQPWLVKKLTFSHKLTSCVLDWIHIPPRIPSRLLGVNWRTERTLDGCYCQKMKNIARSSWQNTFPGPYDWGVKLTNVELQTEWSCTSTRRLRRCRLRQ